MKEGVLGIVFNADRVSVLLVQRRDVPVWVLPGGGIDAGETPEQAVIREVREETGLHVSVRRKAALYAPINRFTANTHIFECTCQSGQVGTGSETRGIGYFPLKELPEGLFPYHKEWIQEVSASLNQLVEKPMSKKTFRHILGYYIRRPTYALRYLLSRYGCPINSA